MGEDNGQLDLDALKAGSQSTVELRDGALTVTVRRVLWKEMLGLGILPVLANPEATQERRDRYEAKEVTTADEELQAQFVRCYLEVGVVTPRVWAGEYTETPKDRVHYSVFTDIEVNEIVAAIDSISERGGEEAAAAARFRGEQVGSAAGSGESAVRDGTE